MNDASNGLHRSPGDDEHKVRVDPILLKNPLLLSDPPRRNVITDRAMGEQNLGRFSRESRQRSRHPTNNDERGENLHRSRSEIVYL